MRAHPIHELFADVLPFLKAANVMDGLDSTRRYYRKLVQLNILLNSKQEPTTMIQTRQLTYMLSLFVLPTLLDSFSPVSLRHPRCGDIAAQTSTEFGAKTVPDVEIVSEMPPPMPTDLKNHYYLLRHGQSTANVAGIISSSRSLAYSDEHGLTELGYQQGKSSANDLVSLIKQQSKPGDQIIFVSSPFARARQTAQACLDGLEESYLDELNDLDLNLSTDIQMEDRLMERYFGKLDGEAIYTYAYVWPVDKFNTTHTAFETESVAAVATRLRRIVEDHESKYRNSHIIWTSHADVLQIAQVYAADYDNVGSFSSFRFGNGEVRAVKHGADTLPDAVPLQPLDRTI